MKIILCFFLGIFISCNKTNTLKPTIGRSIVSEEKLAKSDAPYFTISNLNLLKIKLCGIEIDKSDLSIVNQESLQLLKGNKLSSHKKILINFNKLQELSLANWQTCQSIIFEGNFSNLIMDLTQLTLSIENEKKEMIVFSKEIVSKDNNPLFQKINFEIKNQKEFLELLLVNGNLNVFFADKDKDLNRSSSYYLSNDLIFEQKEKIVSPKDFEEVCYYNKCGRFLELENFLWLENRSDDAFWVKYKNKYFYGKYKEILNQLSTTKVFSLLNVLAKEFKNPISIESLIYGNVKKGVIEEVTNRISTGWVEESCHYERERDRHEKINKMQVCHDRQMAGEIVYKVAQISSFKDIKFNNDFFLMLFPQFRTLEKCSSSSGEGVNLKCDLVGVGASLLSKDKLIFSSPVSPVEMATIGFVRVINNNGQGRNGFHLNYPLPTTENINLYKDLSLKGWVKVQELSSVLTEEFYRN